MSPDQSPTSFCLCVPTFRRPQLLRWLLEDALGQTSRPELTVVIDGDPASKAVSDLLEELASKRELRSVYVPSNHANLAYQRYLGWRVAKATGAGTLVYLDDDLRIPAPVALERLLAPLRAPSAEVVGCTGDIRFGDAAALAREVPAVQDRYQYARQGSPTCLQGLGAARSLRPGDLSPVGNRCPPERAAGACAPLQWLRGGVMAYRMSALGEDCFSQDLFALAEIGCGHGEDTLLSRRVAARGRLVMVFDAEFDHPNADAPKAYATRAFRMAWGTAYSRRLLNDNYRWPHAPRWPDRAALLRHYAGATLLSGCRALVRPLPHRVAYAWGYLLGATKGLLQPPRHRRLTPRVDWQADALQALAARREFAHRS